MKTKIIYKFSAMVANYSCDPKDGVSWVSPASSGKRSSYRFAALDCRNNKYMVESWMDIPDGFWNTLNMPGQAVQNTREQLILNALVIATYYTTAYELDTHDPEVNPCRLINYMDIACTVSPVDDPDSKYTIPGHFNENSGVLDVLFKNETVYSGIANSVKKGNVQSAYKSLNNPYNVSSLFVYNPSNMINDTSASVDELTKAKSERKQKILSRLK